MTYPVSHFAILSSGEFLIAGYDQANSTARLVLLNSSGELLRTLDLPASGADQTSSAPFGSIQAAKEARTLIGFVAFSAYKDDVLVWRSGSNDPILDVGAGGRVREVPVQPPLGSVLLSVLTSNDRWAALFRSQGATEGSPLNQTDYSYYELRPQDASLSARLLQAGTVPLTIACESNGEYISYSRDKDNKLVLLTTK